MILTPTARHETRLLSVSGAWVRGTWIDDAVLAHCRRSAHAGFGFRVRSRAVGAALVDAGLAVRDAAEPTVLTGTAAARRLHLAPGDARIPPTRADPRTDPGAGETADQTAGAAAGAGAGGTGTGADAPSAQLPLGACASTHHVHPVEALVPGIRQRGASPADGFEPVALCRRCATMLADAGFFTAR